MFLEGQETHKGNVINKEFVLVWFPNKIIFFEIVKIYSIND